MRGGRGSGGKWGNPCVYQYTGHGRASLAAKKGIPHWLNNELHNEGCSHCKSSLLNNEAFELIVGTMSPAHCATKHNEPNNEAHC